MAMGKIKGLMTALADSHPPSRSHRAVRRTTQGDFD